MGNIHQGNLRILPTTSVRLTGKYCVTNLFAFRCIPSDTSQCSLLLETLNYPSLKVL